MKPAEKLLGPDKGYDRVTWLLSASQSSTQRLATVPPEKRASKQGPTTAVVVASAFEGPL